MPADGRGLNPLLQNYWMVIHPPSLYTGFVGMTIPYAFGMAALITGHLDDSWLRAVRRWTMFSWLFLSFGLTLGMIWAYEVLGLGRLLGLGSGRERRAAAVVHGDGVPALGDRAGAPQHAAHLERHAGHPHVLPDHLRHVHDAIGRRAVGARVRVGPGAGEAVHRLHGRDPDLQLRPGHLPPAAAARAQRARLVGVARGRVPREQLGAVVLGALRPVRHDVSDAERGGDRQPADRRPAVLQQVDGADRPVHAVPDRLRPAARLAEIDAQQSSRSVPVADAGGAWSPAGRSSRSASASGRRVCVSRCRRSSPARILQEFWRGTNVRRGVTGTDIFTALVGLVGRNKRRYGGYIVHLGIMLMFLGFAGTGFKRETQLQLKLGAADDARRLHAAQRRREGERRRPEADGHGLHQRVQERQADRHDVPGEIFLPQARAGTDDRGRDSPLVRRGSLHRAGVPAERSGGAVGQPADQRQSAGGLDLVRVRGDGDRHRHRAAARADLRVRARQAARGGGAAGAAARARRCC